MQKILKLQNDGYVFAYATECLAMCLPVLSVFLEHLLVEMSGEVN